MPVQKTLSVNHVYNMNDIATYFTLLVGIYFPSVTGELITPLKAQHVTIQPSIHYRLKKENTCVCSTLPKTQNHNNCCVEEVEVTILYHCVCTISVLYLLQSPQK